MAQKPYDPLAMIPSPEVIRTRLQQTLTLAERLRLLLDLSERMEALPPPGDTVMSPATLTRPATKPAAARSAAQTT